MENLIIRNLPTAVEITSDLKADLLEYLNEYKPIPNEAEPLRILKGVLELHNENTRDFLKYSDFQILNIIRQMIYYGDTVSRSIQVSERINKSCFIVQTMRGINRAVTVTKFRKRSIEHQLEEVKTNLMGIHSIDLTAVRIENHKGNESYKLSLIERKEHLERLLDGYTATINHAEKVEADINKWFQSEAPDEVRESVKGLNDLDREQLTKLLDPYVNDIVIYAKMNG